MVLPLLGVGGPRPSWPGTKMQVRFSGGKKTVIDGPFTEAKELVAGFWLWQVTSLDEAIEWLKRAPFEDTEVEIRPVFEAEDFGEAYTPELRAQEDRLREDIAARQAGPSRS